MRRTPVVALICLLATGTSAVAGERIFVSINPLTTFSMEPHDSWRVQQRRLGGTLEVRITPGKGDFLFLITVMPLPADRPLPTTAGLQAMVADRARAALEGAVQSKVELTEVKASGGIGFVYHVTDRNPERGPGDYREAHQGAFLLGSHLVTVTVLTHPGDHESVEQALAALRTLRVTG